MANAFYAKGAQRILTGAINFTSVNIKAALVKNTYALNLETDEFYSTISAHVGPAPVALTGKTVTGRVFDADDTTFPTVAAGDTYKGIALFLDTGTSTTSPLIAFIDTITGFPFAANGSDVTARWDNGAFKIFSL